MTQTVSPDRYPNPLRLEGLFYLARAILTLALGTLLILDQREALINAPEPETLVAVGCGAGLALWGLALFWQAFERLVRINLLDNGIAPFPEAFGADGLDKLLEENTNPSRRPAGNRLERLLSSLFGKYTLLPPPYRWMATRSISAALRTVIIIFLMFAIFFFLRAYDKTVEAQWVTGWASAVILLLLLGIWNSARPTAAGTEDFSAGGLGVRSIVLALVLVALAVFGLRALGQQEGVDLAQAPAAPALGGWLGLLALGALAVTAAALAIVAVRAKSIDSLMDSTKDQSHWDRMTHPQQIMIAARAYLDNRFGRRTRMCGEDVLMPGETQANQGQFRGLIETESAVRLHEQALTRPQLLPAIGISALGHLLLAFGTYELWRRGGDLDWSWDPALIDQALVILLPFMFGSHLARMATWPLSEVDMTSTLLKLQAEGTFAMTRAVAGGSMHDTFRDEVDFHRANFLLSLQAGTLISACFALPRSDMARRHRFVLRLDAEQTAPAELKAAIDNHLAKQRRLGGAMTEDDVKGLDQVSDINLRYQRSAAEARQALPPEAARPQIAGDRDGD